MADEFAHLSDEALVELCRVRGTGDSRPFTELFHRHRNLVWRICYRFVGNAHDAEDLMQEVFFKAYRSLSQFRGTSSFTTWLHQIAANTAHNELRRRSRRPQVSNMLLDELAEIIPHGAAMRTYPLLPRLAEAWERLRPEERQVLRLKDLEQRPYEEITQILAISLLFFQDSDYQVLVPGHGPVGGRDDGAVQLEYLDVTVVIAVRPPLVAAPGAFFRS